MSEQVLQSYLRNHFIPWDALIRRAGGSEADIAALIEAKASPGIVYSLNSNGECWSALAAFVGAAQPERAPNGMAFFAPSAIYWLRRGLLLMRDGLNANAAASANRDGFLEQFSAALQAEPLAAENYPEVFPSGRFDSRLAWEAGIKEWAGWVSGAYAVCLRSFTGTTCVTKEALARRLRTQFADGAPDIGSVEALDLVERLSTFLMPFAPFERTNGTPGRAVDRVLTFLDLGSDEPFVNAWAAS